ncbi:MAG: twin-arginine translocase subunit TatC [Thermoleophilaceae bacterium]|nr:twin-arginine translocase subunit TatC [Thermoleophilaceae bacterium]
MLKRIRPISHDDQLTIVEHLDELRTRIIVSLLALATAFGLCIWQKHLILDIVNRPLHGRHPITLGVTEPFMTTLTLCAYAAIVISLPVVLYQLYAFVLPAFSPSERRVALPLMLMVPLLFIAGVVFAYYVVMPPALKFLLNFNDHEFNVQIRARDYYSFVSLTLLSVGILFQVPVGILALTRLGIVTPRQLRKNRRYAILVCTIIAALLPSVDPVSMILETIPLIVLYELSILLSAAFGRPATDVPERVPQPEGL